MRSSSSGVKNKNFSHLSHILQVDDWLLTCPSTFLIIALQWGQHWRTTSETSHRQALLYLGVWVGGHTWKMTPPFLSQTLNYYVDEHSFSLSANLNIVLM